MRLPAFVREPLVQFLLIGAALFLWYAWSGGGSGPGSTRILVQPGRIDSLAAGFTKTWQRPPTEAELKGLLDDHVREEIATREAMAMGLDRDDTVIRRRLRQKLEFLVEDTVDSVPPTEDELRAWLAAHADSYRGEPGISFTQIYFSPERRGRRARADALVLLERLPSPGRDVESAESREDRADGMAGAGSESARGIGGQGAGADPAGIGDPTMLPSTLTLEPRGSVARIFGEEFADAIFGLEPGRWAGPVESAYGLHLVLIEERTEGVLPSIEEIRPAVERDLLGERRRKQLEAIYASLLDKYTVVIEARPESAGGATP